MSKKKRSKVVARTSRSALRALNPRNRRGLLSFWRIIKYGMANFFRNAWLSAAATAIMVITLLIISATLIARQVMVDTIGEIKDRVDMSIYVQQDISEEDVTTITRTLESLDSVVSVTYTSPEQSRENFALSNIDDEYIQAALREATDKFPGTFNVRVVDINDTSELEELVESDEVVAANIDENNLPTFASSRRAAIDNISRTMNFIQRVGITAGTIFIVIASLIIFNTIRMAIFNRRNEIYMMKLIGANKSFIRGPFIVEAVQYGVLAAVIAFATMAAALWLAKDTLINYGIAVEPAYDILTTFWPLALLALLIVGTIIGVVSSLLATRKYLKLA